MLIQVKRINFFNSINVLAMLSEKYTNKKNKLTKESLNVH